ncbi:hypothetical protein EYF80_015503 [Liparis tanakae]|uniref:Uncharacterized protein n=1 Tax=Liparis tanakae TaxID=230148 RepID=A0A4Z2I8Q8_9TELE|nr:hypothetical protein EYF80_015503 [Liparis tanakae]
MAAAVPLLPAGRRGGRAAASADTPPSLICELRRTGASASDGVSLDALLSRRDARGSRAVTSQVPQTLYRHQGSQFIRPTQFKPMQSNTTRCNTCTKGGEEEEEEEEEEEWDPQLMKVRCWITMHVLLIFKAGVNFSLLLLKPAAEVCIRREAGLHGRDNTLYANISMRVLCLEPGPLEIPQGTPRRDNGEYRLNL